MKKHVIDLLYESKEMNGYEFESWLKDRTDDELKSLNSMAYSLSRSIEQEKECREG